MSVASAGGGARQEEEDLEDEGNARCLGVLLTERPCRPPLLCACRKDGASSREVVDNNDARGAAQTRSPGRPSRQLGPPGSRRPRLPFDTRVIVCVCTPACAHPDISLSRTDRTARHAPIRPHSSSTEIAGPSAPSPAPTPVLAVRSADVRKRPGWPHEARPRNVLSGTVIVVTAMRHARREDVPALTSLADGAIGQRGYEDNRAMSEISPAPALSGTISAGMTTLHALPPVLTLLSR